MHFDWKNRSSDFERWRKPPESFGPTPPTTIHLAGESRASELKESLDRERQDWASKLVVKNTRFQPHRYCTVLSIFTLFELFLKDYLYYHNVIMLYLDRKGIRTELTGCGPRATTQLDKLQGLLKDSPQKYSLKQNGLPVYDIPALHVVHNPSVDSRLNIINVSNDSQQDGSKKGYVPGPNETRSLKLDSNVIPLTEPRAGYSCRQQHRELSKNHSQEFRYV